MLLTYDTPEDIDPIDHSVIGSRYKSLQRQHIALKRAIIRIAGFLIKHRLAKLSEILSLLYSGCLDAFYPTTDPELFCQSVRKIRALDLSRFLPLQSCKDEVKI